MSLNKNELVAKLEEISVLYHKVLSIKHKMDDFEPEDNYNRKIKVPAFPGEDECGEEREILESEVDHKYEDAMEQMAEAYDDMYHPKKPTEPVKPSYTGADTQKSKAKQRKLRLISNIGLGIAIFFILGAIVGTSDTPEALPAILIIAALGAAAFVGGRLLGKKEKQVEDKLEAEAKAEYDRKIATLNNEYKNTIKAYEDECKAYAPIRQTFLNKYADWREVYLKSLAEEEKISDLLEADRQAAVSKIESEEYTPALMELAEINDILTPDYLHAVDIIIDLLKTGRADNVKEAINLYEEMLYRERQLKLQREQEEQRRREEEMRRQDEERRYQEEKEFREAQERQRRREEERRLRNEETRAREEARAREAEALRMKYNEQERIRKEEYKKHMNNLEQERKQRNAAQAQCRACAHAGHCNMMVHNSTPTCTGFTPRR